MLMGEDWRGLEQAGLLLVALDEKEIVSRLLILLEHPRGEVAPDGGLGTARA